MLNCATESIDSWGMFDKMLSEANVVITPGAGFGEAGEGFFRISAFNSKANVDTVCRIISPTQGSTLGRNWNTS